MAKDNKEHGVSFADGEAPEAVAPAEQEDNSTMVTAASSINIGKVQGEKRRRDILLPSLKIAQGVGGLADKQYTLGSIVLNGAYLLSEGDVPVKLTVLGAQRGYIENLPYGGDKVPRRWKTEKEVRDAGLHLEWVNNNPPPAQDILETVIAIESPEENPLFPFTFEEKGKPLVHVTLAMWTLRGMSFDRAGRLILTADDYSLKAGLHTGSWELTTKREKTKRATVAVPVLLLSEKNSLAKQEFFLSIV